MPSPSQIVIDTSPLLALLAGCGSLELLRGMFAEILVPREDGIWLSNSVAAFALRKSEEA